MPPLLQLVIFSHAATMEIKNLKVIVLDKSNTLLSRELVAGFNRGVWFREIVHAKNEHELEKAIRGGGAHMGVLIQGDFAARILGNKPATVQIVVDGRQTNTAGIASGYATQIINDFAAQYSRAGPSIEVETRSWFNPNLDYTWYTVVSLVALLSLVITLLLTSMSIARERELGTFDQLIVSPLSSVEILAGKTVAPMVIATVMAMALVFIIQIFYKVPFVGSIWLLLGATCVALLSFVGVGLFISSICKTQQQALLGVFVFQMPAVLLSGFVSPVEDMPEFFQKLSYLNPIRFYIVIVKGLFLKGMAAVDVAHNLIPLCILAVVTLSVATWTFKRKLD
jgi:ABC-2 type transport system permease protein